MYCLAVEHFVQVAVRIKRGANHGNRGVAQIHRYLHCLICAQWGLLQNSNNPMGSSQVNMSSNTIIILL